MKIYSEYKELEGIEYKSAEACAKAEAEIDKQRAQEVKQEKVTRKKLAEAVEVAENALTDAYKEYDEAKEQARMILDKANEEALAVLKPAQDKINTAEAARRDAIVNYNRQFGAYQSVYTGDRALQEYERIQKHFDNLWNNAFSNWNSFFRF